MAYLRAKMTYPSRRTFMFKQQGEKPNVYFEPTTHRYIIQTFPGLARPEEGEAGLRLEFDEATAKALASALLQMTSKGDKAA